MLSKQEIEKMASTSTVITNEFFDELAETQDYNSIGMMNWAISLLTDIKNRLESGIVITYNDKKLSSKDYMSIVKEKFSTYVYKEVFKASTLKHKVFFSIQNTDEGFDLVYTKSSSNKLFKWIADLNETDSLVYIRANYVVYIKSGDSYTPFLSEHGNIYTYDPESGKIREQFK